VTTAGADLPPASCVKRDVDQYFSAAGARLRYRDEGGGPPVLMVHGWTLDLEMWEPQVAALCDAFRVIRLDRRGFGLSSGLPSVAQDIADIGSLCEHLAIGRVALVGMSQGVRAVMGFALRAPQRISCLILDGPPAYGGNQPADDEVPLSHFRAVAREGGMDAFRREWSAHPLLRLRTGNPRMHELLSAMIMRYPGNDLVAPVAATQVPTGSSMIGSIDAPVLVITGDHDMASRTRAAKILAGQLTGAERAVIQGAGHLPNLDNPKDYNAVVRTFLERFAVPLR
jgi:pimeloyl-ACP methyl ester carboxylesterase